MHRMKTATLIVGAALIAAVAVLAVIAASGSGDSRTTYAGVEPTATPKPDGLGNLSGLYDVWIHNGAKAIVFYDCIARQDHDSITNEVKVTSQCYADIGLSDPNSAIPCLPGEGADANCDGAPDLDGPPPPPPYNSAPPTKMNGDYDPGTDTLTLTSCVPNIGGLSGPNIIVHAVVPNAKAQLVADGKQTGTVSLYNNVSNAACDSKYFGDQPPAINFTINLHRVGDGNPVPWRTPGDLDYDDDGCLDVQELDKTGSFKCGDDPYNPYDSEEFPGGDISGAYSMTTTAIRADWDKVAGELIPGAYFHCIGDTQQEGDGLAPDSITTRLVCYTDSTLIPVNPEMGPETGDGLAGAAPPPPFYDVDDVQTVLSGQINTGDNTLEMEGCFEDRDVQSPLGNVFVRTVGVDVHTGSGAVDIWVGQTTENCLAGTPVGDPSFDDAPIDMVRQATKDANRDSDGDDCPDKNELSDNQQQGGLRDPYNRWDYMNPTRDGQNRVDDILATVNQYFIDAGDPAYTKKTDRTSLVGSNPWNLGPPNGQQRVDDILASVKSYFHDCDGGNYADPDLE